MAYIAILGPGELPLATLTCFKHAKVELQGPAPIAVEKLRHSIGPDPTECK